ncbi:homoserine/homoserine lactone efflux protein [Denitromonas ohlonensis]|jgi:homoserine/homoserine lactone efflux protein|uniref:Homoserine/homoserine lactone efflux protein n=2 Tax=Denitromonas TaxID=139331 RepID=A0A558EUP0_9RHOO|nr:homoserine/homoserine lactone efflux protein [Denitromonas ohlonensis]TVT49557.1 MAG: homoserine/homoserine lactone efflux protein [Denitromonas halophila]TVO68776.1 homoserine/homoserine lactone efflux protein [Denitromonas ohlonensis]TVO72858.1 homoserine/homoserine lactone efflux protein [Denitromonas ohlonensis]TVT75291.1 MAG: homoserine/homoserine lactone efflux protein [Denitromonas halophila]TVT76659.1 MAG: homoserine/homoserine lactone efflux protein [Denitromonas halophila]
MAWQVWLAFLVASIIISVTPGPGAVVSMSVGLRYGYRVSLQSIAGLQVALVIQLAIVAAGLGAVLATSATAFLILKICGAAYLVWLGIQKWRSAGEPVSTTTAIEVKHLFRTAVLINLTNPKAIIFMAALVPQFIDPAGNQWLQFLILCATTVVVDVFVMSCYSLLATRFRPWLADVRAQRLQNRVFGGLFVTAGAALAATSRH